jgi:hypothetical protein
MKSKIAAERGIHAASMWPCKFMFKRAEARAPGALAHVPGSLYLH